MKERLAIVEGVRTPFAKAGGVFSHLEADALGAAVLRELLNKVSVDPQMIEEVIFGNVSSPIHAANVARVIALKAGMPLACPAYSVHRNCASGMEAVAQCLDKVQAGRAKIMIAGGAESMSHIPLYIGESYKGLLESLMKSRSIISKLKALSHFRLSMLKPVLGVKLGLSDPVCGMIMGETAEVLSREFAISRQEQDLFSLESHKKASKATKEGHFKSEILPIPIPPKYESALAEDDGIRHDQNLEALQKLKAYFEKDTGTVTVGNSSQLTDGAVALLVMAETKARELGLEPLGYLSEYACAGLEGSRMGLGPVYATARLFEKTGLYMKDFDLVELNEAFAAQVLACQKAFGSAEFAKKALGKSKALGEIDPAKLNIWGGAVALGHPVGATGARLILSLLHQLRHTGGKRALATLCIGGGQGMAVCVEVC